MPKRTKYFKEDDRRGRHKKRKREPRPPTPKKRCTECAGRVFFRLPDHSGDCCERCGACTFEQYFEPSHDQLRSVTWVDFKRSVYHQRDYFAERMRQFTDTDPRFTLEEENEIKAVFALYRAYSPETYKPENLFKDHIGRIFRTLKQQCPDMKYGRRLERWLQARVLLYPESEVGSLDVATKLKVMFDAVADTFIRSFKNTPCFDKKNIPSLDLLCLVLLYNISLESLERYGWYFLSPDVIHGKACSVEDYARLERLLLLCNKHFLDNMNRHPKHNSVRQETIDLFAQTKFEFHVPEFESLLNITSRHPYAEHIIRHEYTKTLLHVK